MSKRKKSFYIRVQFVKRLKGFEFWRLSIFHRSRLIRTIGYYDQASNLLFLNFNEIFYYVLMGLDLKNRFDHNFGKYLKIYNLGNIILISLYNWFFSNNIQQVTIPKRFWLPFFKRTLKILYYCLFRNLLKDSELGSFKGITKSRVINKRLLVIRRLFPIN